MRRRGLAVLIGASLGVLAPAQASAAPSITLEPRCDVVDGRQVYSVDGHATGFRPGEVVAFTATTGGFAELGAGSLYYTVPAEGEFGFGGVGLYTPLGFTTVVAYSDANRNGLLDKGETVYATATIDNPCGPPTRRETCKNDGWRSYPSFRNQGQCIAFVERGEKPGG